LVKSLLATKQVCDFQRFRIVLLVSLHDVKNALRSSQNRSKLSAWIWVFYRVIVS